MAMTMFNVTNILIYVLAQGLLYYVTYVLHDSVGVRRLPTPPH